MPDGSTHPQTGHNGPPPYRADAVEAHDARAREFLDAAGEWLELGEISSDEQASELNDFITGVKKNQRAADEDRKADKKPHDDAGKDVQAAYSPVIDMLKRAVERVSPLQTAWLQKKEDERRAEAERQRQEAERARRAAEEAAAKANSRNDIAGEVAAEEAAKRAAELQKEADRTAKGRSNVKSATGGGRTASLRTTWKAKVTALRVAVMTFADEPELHECLCRLAERRARAAGFDPEAQEIPGFELTAHRSAV